MVLICKNRNTKKGIKNISCSRTITYPWWYVAGKNNKIQIPVDQYSETGIQNKEQKLYI